MADKNFLLNWERFLVSFLKNFIKRVVLYGTLWAFLQQYPSDLCCIEWFELCGFSLSCPLHIAHAHAEASLRPSAVAFE